MKKRYFALVLVVVLILVGMAACGQAQNQEEQQEPQDLKQEVQQSEKPTDTAEPVETDTPDEPEETQAPADEDPGDNTEYTIISDAELLSIPVCVQSPKEFIRQRVEGDVTILRELGYDIEDFCSERYNHDFIMWNKYLLKRKPIYLTE